MRPVAIPGAVIAALTGLGICALASAAPARSPATRPAHVATGGGLHLMLGQIDPQAVLRATGASGMIVYIQTPDAAHAEILRRAADAAGLLNRRIFVCAADLRSITLASNLADVATIAPGAAADDAEIMRVLRPGGAALMPDGSRRVKPPPAGTDNWSHPYHGPDNNTLSADAHARWPYTTHFLAEPLFASQPEVTVAAGGRIFKAFGHMTFRAYQNEVINQLYAFNGYNGALLWKRPLREGFMIHRNTMIATPDALYLGDDESCKIIDPATGDVLDQITGQQPDEMVWKWMAIENGVLYALLGGPEVPAAVSRGTITHIGGWPWGMWPGYDYSNPATNWGFGRTLLAIDLKTRKTLWRHREQEFIDARGVCMAARRIFCWAPQRFLAAIDAATGNVVWRRDEAALLDAIGPNGRAQHYLTGFATSVYVRSNGRVLMFAGPQRQSLAAVSADDGRLLWQRKDGNFQLVLRPEALYAMGQQGTKSFKFDYATGNILAEFVGRRACTRATGTIDSVLFRAQEGTIRWDMSTDALIHIAPMRPGCHDGVIVSDGLLYWGPWICGCHLTLVGIICLQPAAGAGPPPANGEPRLYTAAQSSQPVAPFDVRPDDWPAWRRDNARTGITPVTLARGMAHWWTAQPDRPHIPTAPVAAGGLVLVGSDDGTVCAIDAATGRPRWKAHTDGPIYFPPALAGGRAFVGSNDGHVYAFEAATGRLLWRFRAAPLDRRIPVYGQMMSTWPVAGGVVATDTTVYAAAGISHFDGTHVYALDAATGRIQWHNDSSGIVDDRVKNGISLCGPLQLRDATLSFPGGNVYAVAAYDAPTGRCLNTPAGPRTVRRVFLHPRKLWEPIEGAEHVASAGRVRIQGTFGGARASVAFQPAGPASGKAWSKNLATYWGSAAAANALVLLGRLAGDAAPADSVIALKLDSGEVLWSYPLPAAPVHWGLAIDSRGCVFVCLDDGRIIALRPQETP